MTLAQLIALDPEAMWAALSPEVHASIVAPLLRSEFAAVTAQDDGTDASNADQKVAAGIEHSSFQEAMDAIGAAFPTILGDDFSALRDGPTADMFVGEGTVRLKGIQAPRKLYSTKALGPHVRLGGRKVSIAGWKNLATEDAPVWEGWTQAQIDAERLRRHPDQFVGPRLPAFALVAVTTDASSATHHVDDSYDRAA